MQNKPPPIAEIVSIGDEVNRGEVIDTNAAWLGQQLTLLGFKVHFRQGVNDQIDEIKQALTYAASRSTFVLVTGGLGATEDDLTVDVVSSLLGVSAVVEPGHEQNMLKKVPPAKLTTAHQRQVRIPKGATVLANEYGYAPGFQARIHQVPFFFLPGVPREMKPMFQNEVIPRLSLLLQGSVLVTNKTYRIFGLSEAQIRHRLQDFLAKISNQCFVHYRLVFPEVLLSFVVQREHPEEAQALLESFDVEVRKRLGGFVYAEGNDVMPFVVGRKLTRNKHTLATAESCTGGMLSEWMTALPGASTYHIGGVVSYHNHVKRRLLGVTDEIFHKHGAVSAACVEQMANGVRDLLRSTYGIAISGIAGPGGGTTAKPVGTIYIGWATPEQTRVQHYLFAGDRDQIRRKACYTALDGLDRMLTPERGAVLEE